MIKFASSSSAIRRGVTRRLTRSVSYKLPSISMLNDLKLSNEGLDGLFSARTLDDLWFKQGEAIVNRLNAGLAQKLISEPPSDLAELITLTFSKPELKEIYENALLLHNLQFVMESIKPNAEGSQRIQKPDVLALLKTPTIQTSFKNEPENPELRDWIIDSFGSIAEFRTLLLNSAKGIKGNGLTWLVAQATYSDSAMRASSGLVEPDTSYNKLAVMNTYNAGIVDDSIRSGQITKLKEQNVAKREALKKRRQERLEIEGTDLVEELEEETPKKENDTVLGTVEEAEEAFSYSDRKIAPLLAIDASMKVYLPDYGVFGKDQYLDNVWDCINWEVVAARAPARFKPSVAFET